MHDSLLCRSSQKPLRSVVIAADPHFSYIALRDEVTRAGTFAADSVIAGVLPDSRCKAACAVGTTDDRQHHAGC